MSQKTKKTTIILDNSKNDTKPISKKLLDNVKKDLQKIKSRPRGFVIFPPRSEISFETQETKEKILILMRKHIITNLKWIFYMIIGIIFSFLFLFKTSLLDLFSPGFRFITIIIWLILISVFIIENLLKWYFNVYIITDERIIDIDFYSLVAKRISETKIDNIEDVSYSQGGTFQSFFNYGTIDIQTAGEKAEFDFEKIPYPEKIASILNTLILHEEQEKIEGRIS